MRKIRTNACPQRIRNPWSQQTCTQSEHHNLPSEDQAPLSVVRDTSEEGLGWLEHEGFLQEWVLKEEPFQLSDSGGELAAEAQQEEGDSVLSM